MSFFNSKPGRRTNEDVFFAYYSRLLEWATQITHNDPAEAEDLVHDFYLRVSRITRPIDDIEQIESYLFKVLRNLYYARLRRAEHDPINDLSIVDYDSVEQSLAVADRHELLFVRDHLRQVCRYACERKSTVRSASVLILRFFNGYYPGELMKILQTSRSAVDKLLQVARAEAKLHLERPEAFRSILPSIKPPIHFSTEGESTQQLFRELQRAIFSAGEGKCFDRSSLESMYASEANDSRLTTRDLSHLVSCRACLELVNAILGLPSLESRSPEDGVDRDGTGSDSGSRIIPIRKRLSKKGPSMRKLERRARELFEHRPGRLAIAVDGGVRSSQKVTAEVNEFYLKLARKEEPSFIEVLSEQGSCLAVLPVDHPDSPDRLKQSESVSLSNDRSLTLTISFATDHPIIHVLYLDPVMSEMASTDMDGERASSLAVSETGHISNKELPPILSSSEEWTRRWTNRLSAWLQRLFLHNRNPLFAGAALLSLGAIVCLWSSHKTVAPPMSANTLLQHAEAADQAVVSSTGPKIIFQKVRIRTTSQTIEQTIHRDTSGRRKPKQQPLDRQTLALSAKLARAGVKWDEPLSAVTYQEWREHSHVTGDIVRKTGDNLLTLTTTIADANVREESLTVRATDFHPVVRTISFRDTGNVEIAELNYNVMPWKAADQSWFEPVAKAAVSDLPAIHATIHLPHTLSDLKLDQAELAVRTSLNLLHADTGEPISFTRGSDGIVVKGVVATNARKREILSYLALIPNVRVSILSAEEIGSRRLSSVLSVDGGPTHVYSVQAQPSPLEQYIREKNLPIERLAPALDNLLDGSLRILQSGVHLSEVKSRFGEANQLPLEEQTQLKTLSRNYIATITTGIYANKQILSSLGFDGSSTDPAAPGFDASGEGIDEQLRRYRQLCLEMVSNGTGQVRPAQVIAREILASGDRIRLRLAITFAAAQKGNN